MRPRLTAVRTGLDTSLGSARVAAIIGKVHSDIATERE
jgi:hypothetical protein